MKVYGIRYRRGFFGKLILQVRVRDLMMLGAFVEPVLVWRDARVEDLPHVEVTA